MRGVFRRLACAGLAGWLVLCAVSSDAEQPAKQVLLLQSFDRGTLVIDDFTGHFRVELDRLAGTPVNVVQVVVGPIGVVAAPDQETVDYIRALFAGRRKPDLIVTTAGPAAVFARKHRQDLFPDTPVLFAAVDQRYLQAAPSGENETAVAVVNDPPLLIDGILRLLPRTRQVFVVTGTGPLSKFWRQVLDEEFTRFQGRVSFVWSEELSLSQILRRCATLPSDSAIFFLNFGTDAHGSAYADARVLAELRATANAPMFGAHSVQVGSGVVGGAVMSIDTLARTTADVASRLLNGATPRSIDVPLQRPGRPTFDWRELQRWGIPESRLPAGSVVLYRGPSLWSEYRFTVLSAAAALIVQSLLIVALLYQRRARRRAEIDSRRSLALAADATRRQTMSALTTSIAHELGQPLSSMIHNAQALQMMVSANRATPGVIEEILSDIRTQGAQATQIIERHRAMLRSRQLEMKPIDLHAVIDDTLALVGHDLRARRVEAVVVPSSTPCIVSGDQVLLQQVLVNLVINAMDAMSESPPAMRQLTIRCDDAGDDVALSVRDAGTGLPPHLDGRLFTPFVTTKSHGLGIGLAIARTIVDAHGGTLEAHNNPEGGATFTLRLRRSEPARIPARASGAA